MVRFGLHRFRAPPTPGEMKQALATQKPETVEGTAEKPFAAMQVIGDINDDGLGMTAWWEPAPEEETAAGEGDEEAAENGAEMEEDG